jgi:CBS domain-containing protein
MGGDMTELGRADAFRGAIGLLVRAPAIVCDPDTPVRTAAKQITESEQTAVVVRLAGRIEILTDRDLRAGVVGGALSTDSPVSAAMSTPVRRVSADQPVSDALTEMLDAGIHHIPLITADGDVLGIVESNDLLALEGAHLSICGLPSTGPLASPTASLRPVGFGPV